jgi:hypothetical protein
MPLVGNGTPPNPPPAGKCAPSPRFGGGGEHTRARKGVGESQLRRGAYTVVLFICTYFVVNTYGYSGDSADDSCRNELVLGIRFGHLTRHVTNLNP